MLARLRAERDRFVGGVLEGLDALPEEARIAGSARFADGRTLVVHDHAAIRFRAAVIATGSSPVVPEPLQGLGDRLLTTDTLFEIPDLPDSLVVLGAGAVGIEIAQAMARLGVAVTVIDSGDSVAGLSEPDLVRQAVDIFGAELDLHLGAEVRAAAPEGDGVRLDWTDRAGRVHGDGRGAGARRRGTIPQSRCARPRGGRTAPRRGRRPGFRPSQPPLRGRADPDRGRCRCLATGSARGQPAGCDRRRQRRRPGGRTARRRHPPL